MRIDPESGSVVRRRTCEWNKPLCSIGRAGGCDVTIRRDGVGDPLHALLTSSGDHHPGATVQNMAMPPCAPVQVNNRPVRGSTPIKNGDILGICGYLFLYEEEEAVAAHDGKGSKAAHSPKQKPPQQQMQAKAAKRHAAENNEDEDSIPSPPVDDSQTLAASVAVGAEDEEERVGAAKGSETPPTEAGSPATTCGSASPQMFGDDLLRACEQEAALAGAAGRTTPSFSAATGEAEACLQHGNTNAWLALPAEQQSGRKATPAGSRGSRAQKKSRPATPQRRSAKRTRAESDSEDSKFTEEEEEQDDEDDDDDGDYGDDEDYDEEEEEEDDDGLVAKPARKAAGHGRKHRGGLFSGYEFVVTSTPDKLQLQKLLSRRGGLVHDSPSAAAAESGTVALLLTSPVDGHLVLTPTCLLCLMRGWPCIDKRWVDDCCEAKRPLPHEPYLLPAVVDDGKGQPQLVQQPLACSLAGKEPGWEPTLLCDEASGDPMEVVLHIHDQHGNRLRHGDDDSFVQTWHAILHLAGARAVKESRVHYDANVYIERLSSRDQRYVRRAEPARVPRRVLAAIARGQPAVPNVSVKWLVHSILLNRKLPFDDYPYEPPSAAPLQTASQPASPAAKRARTAQNSQSSGTTQ